MMDSLKFNIYYRPLRIGWAIKKGDIDSFRRAVKYSYSLWGGSYNPILIVDNEEEASNLIDLFGVDILVALGKSKKVKTFPKKYPHIINPFINDEIFYSGDKDSQPYSNVLDVYNALIHLKNNQEWEKVKEKGISAFTWDSNDPLADIFLIQLGAYPNVDDVGMDYRKLFIDETKAKESYIKPDSRIKIETINNRSISFLSRYNLKKYYSGKYTSHHNPGFFVGSAQNFNDLVFHWNLLASGIPLWFIDIDHLDRFKNIISHWYKRIENSLQYYHHEPDKLVGIWGQDEHIDAINKIISKKPVIRFKKSSFIWNGLNLQAPMMYFNETSSLGHISKVESKLKASFPLSDKTFCTYGFFYNQHLVASLSFFGLFNLDNKNIFKVPYLPELNEFYSREMHYLYSALRVERQRLGIIIKVVDDDSFLFALNVDELFNRIFDLAGFNSSHSTPGLMAKQLIAQLGNLQALRVFKIPGVRRLLKHKGPYSSITKKTALDLIRSTDIKSPYAQFKCYEDLYIESREIGEKLKVKDVFSYLVKKGIFRIGIDLKCPTCQIKSWYRLDTLNHELICDMCDNKFNATQQLTDLNEWHFRRSGVFGKEENVLGAVPVLLTLQQIDSSINISRNSIYSTSLNLFPKDNTMSSQFEIDFIWLNYQYFSNEATIILGECRNELPFTEDDISKLEKIANSLNEKYFNVYIILSKITPFTEDEIVIIKNLNKEEYNHRVIMLTSRELEPFFMNERIKNELNIDTHWNSPEEMVKSTSKIYYSLKEIDSKNNGSDFKKIKRKK